MSKSLCIIGLPNVGKTTLAKTLSLMLGVPYVDTDQWLFLRFAPVGIAFSQWVRTLTETEFRTYELAILSDLPQAPIIALGGGAAAHEACMQRLSEQHHMLLLEREVSSPVPYFLQSYSPSEVERILQKRLMQYRKWAHTLIVIPAHPVIPAKAGIFSG